MDLSEYGSYKIIKRIMTVCLILLVNNPVAAETVLKKEAAKEAKELKGQITTESVISPEAIESALFKKFGFSAHKVGKESFPLEVTGIFEHTSAANRGLKIKDRISKLTITGSDAELVIERAGKQYEAHLTADIRRAQLPGGGDPEYLAKAQLRSLDAVKESPTTASSTQKPPKGRGSVMIWINSGTPYPEILHIDQYLIVADERNTGSPNYSTSWDQWCFKLIDIMRERWSSRSRPVGVVGIRLGLTRSGHFMYTTLGKSYTGYLDTAQEALAFIHSFEGNPVLQFPKDTRANEVHLQITLIVPEFKDLPWRTNIDTKIPRVSSDTLQKNIELYKELEKRNINNTIARLQNQIGDSRSSDIVRSRAAFEIERLKKLMKENGE